MRSLTRKPSPHVSLEEALGIGHQLNVEIMTLNDALEALEVVDPRKRRVVELKFFGGLSVEETSEALNISKETVARDWRLAKAWLLRELSERRQNAL